MRGLKLLVIGLLMIGLTQSAPQASLPSRVGQQFVFIGGGEPTLPPLDLTVREMVEVLADFNVEQTSMSSFCAQFYGMTNFNSKTMTLCAVGDVSLRRETVVHEFLHILYQHRNIASGGPMEPAVEARAQAVYDQLFGQPQQAAPADPSTLPESHNQ